MRKPWQARPTPPQILPPQAQASLDNVSRTAHPWLCSKSRPSLHPKRPKTIPNLDSPNGGHFNWDHVSPVSLYKFLPCLPCLSLFGWGKKQTWSIPSKKTQKSSISPGIFGVFALDVAGHSVDNQLFVQSGHVFLAAFHGVIDFLHTSVTTGQHIQRDIHGDKTR